MKPDYIKLSEKGVEAGGRHVLHALYGYLGFRLLVRLILLILVLIAGGSALGSLLQAIAKAAL